MARVKDSRNQKEPEEVSEIEHGESNRTELEAPKIEHAEIEPTDAPKDGHIEASERIEESVKGDMEEEEEEIGEGTIANAQLLKYLKNSLEI